MSKKPSIVSMARGAVYVGAAALPQYAKYKQARDAGFASGDAAQYMLENMRGVDKFERPDFQWDVIARQWGPLAGWAIVDGLASRFGVYRKVGRLLGNLGG